MKKLSNINIKRLVIYALLAFAMFIIGSWPVSALENLTPDYSYTYRAGSEMRTIYGYDLPNRVNHDENNNSLGWVGSINGENKLNYKRALYFNDNPVVKYTINDTEYTIPSEDSWFTNWIISKWDNDYSQVANNIYLSFSPGISGTNQETLENGRYINYDNYYSYSFYLEIRNDDTSGNSVLYYPYFNSFNYVGGNDTLFTQQYTCVGNGNYSNLIFSDNCNIKITPLEYNNQRALLRYDIKMDNTGYYPTGGFYRNSFNDNGFIYCNNGCTIGSNGRSYFSNKGGLFTNTTDDVSESKRIIGAYNLSDGKYVPFSYRVSMPFDLIMWTDSNDLFCQENCWTQEDTNNNNGEWVNNVENEENDLIHGLFDLDFFNDMGTFAIIESVFDEFRYIMSSAFFTNGNCYSYSIPVLSTNVNLMCGYDFWNRVDNGFFENLWSMFWLGLIGFWVGRNIYLKLLSLVDIDNSVEISSKEVITL